MTDATLRASLGAFDDAALATLANPGLVRRAHRDVEEGKVRLVESAAGAASVEADGQLVRIDTRGPRAADCACRSVAVCRHRIAAVLFLLAQPDEGAPSVSETEITDADPAEIVTAMDLAKLEKWAGKASWRAAHDVAATATTVEASSLALAVTFPDMDGPVRILRGQGFDGIVSKASKARTKAYHAAAVLAAMQHFGQSVPVLVDEEGAEADADAAPVVEVDPAFLAKVQAGLREFAATGMNLAPLPLEESLFELSVSSRADSLPRLASLLRAVAAQMRLRRSRALDYDPHRLLELAATAQALVGAMAGNDADRRAVLAGKVRRDFAPAAPLRLIGCGGERWSTPTGARGVTAWFLERATGHWHSTTLARGPGQDPSFVPVEAWRGHAMWQSEPLEVLAHAEIMLDGARQSADRRLSAPASAQASILTRRVQVDQEWPGVVRDWADLPETWVEQVGLGLDIQETASACLIAPAQVATPFFDDLAQQLVWPVRDRTGHWVGLTIDHETLGSTPVEALEASVKTGWQGLVLVRMERAGDRLSLRPVTLFGAGDPVDLTLWARPWRPVKQGSFVSNWLNRLRQGSGQRFTAMPGSGTSTVLARTWRHLLDRAEIGPSLARSLDGEMDALAERLDDYGLPVLAKRLRMVSEGGLLASAYAVMLARQQRCAVPLLQLH